MHPEAGAPPVLATRSSFVVAGLAAVGVLALLVQMSGYGPMASSTEPEHSNLPTTRRPRQSSDSQVQPTPSIKPSPSSSVVSPSSSPAGTANPTSTPSPAKAADFIDYEGRPVTSASLMTSLIPKDATPEERAKVPRAIITFTLGAHKHQQGDMVQYDLPVPIVVAGWRRLGYEPMIVVVVENIAQTHETAWTDSPPPTIGMLRKMDVELLAVEKIAPLNAGNTAQIMRLSMPAQKQLWDAELVITSDADSLPMKASYFAQRDPSKRVTVYNADIIKYNQFAMCYVAASAATWREFMKLPTSVSTPTQAFKTVHSGSAGWSQDQIVMTARLKGWPGYDQSGNGATQFVELPKTKPFRLDRICCSNEDASWDAYFASWRAEEFSAVDFHLFRYSKEEYTRKWKWTKDVLGVIFPPDVVAELDTYVKEAMGA